MTELRQGTVSWAWLDPTVGREQSGRRPVVVVSADGYNEIVTTLRIVVPVTRTERGWPNHIRLTGVPALADSFAMTEQPRTISADRLSEPFGHVGDHCMREIRRWLADFFGL